MVVDSVDVWSLRVCIMLGEADDAVWRWVGVLSQWDHGLVYTCVSVAVLVYVTAIKVEVGVGHGCLFHPITFPLHICLNISTVHDAYD